MKLLEERLDRAREVGDAYVTITINTGHQPELVANVADVAEANGWHVKAVWCGEANVTYVLLRYTAP